MIINSNSSTIQITSSTIRLLYFYIKPLYTMEKRLASRYTTEFNLQAVAEAKKSSNVQAAKLFGIVESSVRNWRKQKEKLKATPSYKCANRGSKCRWPHLEDKVSKWVSKNRENGFIITRSKIRLYALQEARKNGHSWVFSKSRMVYPVHEKAWLCVKKENKNCTKTTQKENKNCTKTTQRI